MFLCPNELLHQYLHSMAINWRERIWNLAIFIVLPIVLMTNSDQFSLVASLHRCCYEECSYVLIYLFILQMLIFPYQFYMQGMVCTTNIKLTTIWLLCRDFLPPRKSTKFIWFNNPPEPVLQESLKLYLFWATPIVNCREEYSWWSGSSYRL